MTEKEYVKLLVKESYEKYNIEVPIDELPWSGEIIDVKLSDDTEIKVDRMVEFTLCALYSYYFIDRYCKVLDPIYGPVPFKLFDFQLEALEDFQKNKKVIFRKSRQVGASVISGAYALWRANFQRAQYIKIVSLSLEEAKEFKEKTIDLNYDIMPGFLKTETTRDGKSITKLKLVNKSNIRVLPKSKNAGRGGTPSLFIIDEAAFNEWMDDIWKAVEPSLDKGGDIIVISTTNGVGNWYHLTYTRAEQQLNEFHPVYIPWWRYPGRSNPWLKDYISGKIPQEEIFEYAYQRQLEDLSYEGNIKDAPWLFKKRANARHEKDFQQEILAEFLGSGSTVITTKAILKLIEFIKLPKWEDTLPLEVISDPIPGLWCWEDRKPDHMYMLTSDTATGHGLDFSTFHVIDVNENEQVAEYKNLIATDKFGQLIKKVARYYNGAYVILETNHPGPAVFNEIYKSKDDPYYNVYTRKKGKAIVSWETTSRSRVLLVEDFFKDIENGYTRIHSQRLVDEVKVFVWSDSGKAEAMKNYNDDLIIAYAIYAHMKDHIFSSIPTTISSSGTSAVNMNAEMKELEWANKDDQMKEILGVDIQTYSWLMGKKIPKGYRDFKTHIDDIPEAVKIEGPPDWLVQRMRDIKEGKKV